MDINASLEDFTSTNYSAYIIENIQETFMNFIEIDKLFFDNLTKPISFRSLIGVSKDDSELKSLSQYLNVALQENFSNLQLNIIGYEFDNNADENTLDLTVRLNCGLLGIPSDLRFKVDMTAKLGA